MVVKPAPERKPRRPGGAPGAAWSAR